MFRLYTDEVIFRNQRAGGISVYCGELLSRAMVDNDVDVRILSAGAQIDNLAYVEKGLGAARSGEERFGNLLLQRMTVAKLPDAGDGMPTVFHGTYYRTAAGGRAKSVLTVHDFTHQKYLHGKQRMLNNILKRKTIGKADAIICISENTKRDLLEYFPEATSKQVTVIYNGASDDYRPFANPVLTGELAQLKERPFILYVGARTSYKNFGFALELLREVPGVALAVAGGPPLSGEERSKAGGCVDRVFHFGNLSNQDLSLLYNNAVALVYPSLYEGFGIPVLEAMKAGCPVVAFDNSSIPEVLGGSGVLLGNNDFGGAAKAICRLMADERYREEIVSAQHEAAKRFSWDTCYQQTKAFYLELLNAA